MGWLKFPTVCVPRTTFAAVLALVVSVQSVAAAGPAVETRPDLLNKLVGDWVLRGELAGKQTIHDVHASWVLNGRYVRLDEVSRDPDDRGRSAYVAAIYIGWEPRSRTYTCIWLDSTAVAAGDGRCAAKPMPNRLPFLFEDKTGTVNFANTFVYDPGKDLWTWQLDDVANGKHTPFGRVVLSRR